MMKKKPIEKSEKDRADTNNNPPLFNYFQLKNIETAKEIERVISQYEGVLPDKVEKYLADAHSMVKGLLFYRAKDAIKQFWLDNRHLTLSDVKGLIDLAMDDIQRDFLGKADKLTENLKRIQDSTEGRNEP